VGNSEQKKYRFINPRRRFEYDIKTNLKEIGHEFLDSTQMAQNKIWWRIFVDKVKTFHKNTGNYLTS
jgi:hypothetical protein